MNNEIPKAKLGKLCSYPALKDMKEGESISVPLKDRQKLYLAWQYVKKCNGINFTGRTIGNTYTVWRIGKPR